MSINWPTIIKEFDGKTFVAGKIHDLYYYHWDHDWLKSYVKISPDELKAIEKMLERSENEIECEPRKCRGWNWGTSVVRAKVEGDSITVLETTTTEWQDRTWKVGEQTIEMPAETVANTKTNTMTLDLFREANHSIRARRHVWDHLPATESPMS